MHSRAEDATQQVFIQSWRNLGSFRGESCIGAWLHRIALHTLFNELKASKRMQLLNDSADDLPAGSASPACGSREVQMDLERAIAALPLGARVVFVLHEIEGLNHGEIADKLGLANGTCKAQLSRARKLLREALKNHEM